MKQLLFSLFAFLYALSGLCQNAEEKLLIEELEHAKADSVKIRLTCSLGGKLANTNPELARHYAAECLELSLKTGDRINEAASYNIFGSLHYNKSEFVEATDYYLKALRAYKEVDDRAGVSTIYTNLGSLNMKQGNLKEARRNLVLAISMKAQDGTIKGLAHCYASLASVCYLEKDMDQALIYFQKGAELARKTNQKQVEVSCLNGAASILYKRENYTEAAKEYEKALAVCEESTGDYRKLIAGLCHNLGSAYRKLGEYDKAFEQLNRSLELAKEINSNEDIKQAYTALKSYYKDKGDFGKALIAEEYASVYKDSFINERTLKAVNEMQEKYKAEERKKEIRQLHRTNSALEEKSTLRYSLLIVSIGAFLLILLALFFYLKQLKARQQRKQAELEQKALRAQMNPHFIFNSLNSIQRMYIQGDEDTANDYMADFSRLLRNILENSGKELIRLNEELEVVRLYMELEMLRTDHAFEFSCEVAEDVNTMEIRIPPLIFQPYLENAIWHGVISKKGEGQIHLAIRKKGPGKLLCEISDNGVGFYSAQKLKSISNRESKGMQITAERLGGTQNVLVEEPETGGTRISLTIQYTT